MPRDTEQNRDRPRYRSASTASAGLKPFRRPHQRAVSLVDRIHEHRNQVPAPGSRRHGPAVWELLLPVHYRIPFRLIAMSPTDPVSRSHRTMQKSPVLQVSPTTTRFGASTGRNHSWGQSHVCASIRYTSDSRRTRSHQSRMLVSKAYRSHRARDCRRRERWHHHSKERPSTHSTSSIQWWNRKTSLTRARCSRERRPLLIAPVKSRRANARSPWAIPSCPRNTGPKVDGGYQRE